jgi:hypothetical protein
MIMNNWKSRIVALISLIAFAAMGSQGGDSIAGALQPGNDLAVQSSAIDQTSCEPRDPLSPCAVEPKFGYPVGELFIVEHFF